jgi:hypothetical protein
MNDVVRSWAQGKICAALRPLLAAELAAGNRVVECGPSLYGHGAVLVLLAEPFRAAQADLPAGIVHRDVNDPHWWKAEYFHPETKHCLACRM